MRVLVNLIPLHEQPGYWLAASWQHWLPLFAEARPDIEWHVLARPNTSFHQPIHVHYYPGKLNNSLQRGLWLRMGLPRLIRRIQPDMIWHADASFALGIRIPQYPTVDALPLAAFSEAPLVGRRESVRLAWKQIRRRAAGCFTTQPSILEYAETQIAEQPDWMQLLPPLVSSVPTSTHPAQELDHLYFLSTPVHPSDPTIIDLLKAFTKFKRRLPSGIYLVIHTGNFAPDAALQQKIATYKHRDQVSVVHGLSPEAEAGLYADAYALIHPGGYQATAFPLLRGMRAQVPVIAPHRDAAAVFPENIFFPFEPSIDGIAQQMMWVYKEENDRAKRILEANNWLAAYPPVALAKAFVNFRTAHLPTR